MRATLFPILFREVLIVLESVCSGKESSGVLSRAVRAADFEDCVLAEGGRRSSLWLRRLGIVEMCLGANNEGSKMLARNSCCETVELSVSQIGLSVKDWKKVSTNEFGYWSDETIAERVGDEDKKRVILTGSFGKFK